jgi:molybdate transport system ATP-binding protein
VTLDAEIQLRIGDLELNVDLDVAEDAVVAILGPNGAGKSTLLRALAGLLAIDKGRIALDGHVLDEPASSAWVPAERRPVGMVFQDYLLFPFLSARENVAFGLRAHGVRRRAAHAAAEEWLVRVGLADRFDAKPRELSGGQAQRVALARAMVTEPRLLLLDEPLAALDAGSRVEIRRELHSQLASAPGVRLIVTHDPVDAASLATHLVIVEHGRVVQQGSIESITEHPRSAYIADLVGINLYHGTARGGTVTLSGGTTVAIADHAPAGDVFVSVHPRAVVLHHELVTGSARNQWQGTVADVDHLGDRVRVRVEGAMPIVAEITREAARELRIAPGSEIVTAVKAAEVTVYPA